MKYGVVKMGFCPIGKFVFSHEDAKHYKGKLESRMDQLGVNYIGIDQAITDGIVRSYDDVEPVVNYLKEQKIDCLFIPHCNFGTESAAGLIAKRLGVPVLLWGPRDEAPLEDGTRYRDSLCGMFATSKVLNKLGVPFTYIENCRVEDQELEDGLDTFLRAANVVKSLKNPRIGLVGNRIDFFWSTIIDESDLLQKFGVEILPFDLVNIINQTKAVVREERPRIQQELEELSKKLDITRLTDEGRYHIIALKDVFLRLAKENNLRAIATESFMSLIEELDACIAYSQAACSDAGIPNICESDVHGAISSIIAEAAALNTEPSFLADVTVRHPENDNGFLLWHDSFPFTLKHPDSPAHLGSHWILEGFNPGMCHWRLKDGDITIIRFDGERGQYKLLAEESTTIPGPFTQNTYVWVEVPNWKSFERKLIEGPYIHHTACIYGRYKDVLQEACKYIEHLSFDR
jgi:L-fucose isomerase-like protein